MSRGLALRRIGVLAVLAAAVCLGHFAELPDEEPPRAADGSPMEPDGALVRTPDGGFAPLEARPDALVIQETAKQVVFRVPGGQIDSELRAHLTDDGTLTVSLVGANAGVLHVIPRASNRVELLDSE